MDSKQATEKIKALLEQGWIARREDDYHDAQQIATEAYKLCEEHRLKEPFAKVLKFQAQIDHDTDNLRDALTNYEKALDIFRQLKERDREAHTLRHMGDIYRELDELIKAESYYNDALDLYRNNKETNPIDLANTLRGLALIREQKPDESNEIALWEEALELYRDVNIQAGVDECLQKIEQLGSKKDLK
ncbi:MAG: tetratricopeptide repeat protein [Fulvivirga sp.]|nr:tetratricopeptide repeat protein [Fulvivirga sp.]